MDIICSTGECPVILDAQCVFYEGANLVCTGINTNDNLQTVIQKLDQKVCEALGGTGTSGTAGTSGSSGSSGSSGERGLPGTHGTSGTSGRNGNISYVRA
jgi:hypothetical protein